MIKIDNPRTFCSDQGKGGGKGRQNDGQPWTPPAEETDDKGGGKGKGGRKKGGDRPGIPDFMQGMAQSEPPTPSKPKGRQFCFWHHDPTGSKCRLGDRCRNSHRCPVFFPTGHPCMENHAASAHGG
jgi:hypothetical protein